MSEEFPKLIYNVRQDRHGLLTKEEKGRFVVTPFDRDGRTETWNKNECEEETPKYDYPNGRF